MSQRLRVTILVVAGFLFGLGIGLAIKASKVETKVVMRDAPTTTQRSTTTTQPKGDPAVLAEIRGTRDCDSLDLILRAFTFENKQIDLHRAEIVAVNDRLSELFCL